MIAPAAARSKGASLAGAAQPVVTRGAVDGEDSPVAAGAGVRYDPRAEYGGDSLASAGADGWELDVGAAAYTRGTGVLGRLRGFESWTGGDWEFDAVSDARMSSDPPTKRPFLSGCRV